MSDDHNGFSHTVTSIVPSSHFTEQISLAEISSKDKPWEKHRKNAEIVSSYYRIGGMDRYAERVDLCSRNLDFIQVGEGKQKRLKLFSAQFCRVRHCTICQWRRSLRWKAKAYEALPKVIADYPDGRWLFLTLTLKNCQLTELRNTLDDMNRAFKRLTDLKVFPGIGWIRSIEVTRGRDGISAHPHIHCLILVKPSYFKADYLSKSDWISLWQQCLRINYKPILDIQAVRPDKSPVGLIAEILKYQCKESDLCADANWFIEYVNQVHKTRAVSVSGVLRNYFKALEEEPEDLIGKSDEQELSEDDVILTFRWNTKYKKYILIRITRRNTATEEYRDTG